MTTTISPGKLRGDDRPLIAGLAAVAAVCRRVAATGSRCATMDDAATARDGGLAATDVTIVP